MKIKHFSDTDTALVEFADKLVQETREISEDIGSCPKRNFGHFGQRILIFASKVPKLCS